MSTTTTRPAAVSQRPTHPPVAWRVVWWAALALYVTAAIVYPLLGTRERSWDALADGLRHGDVREVRIEGALGGPDGFQHSESGTAHVDLEWQGRWGRQVTTVGQVVGDAGITREDGEHVVTGRVDEALRALNPQVVTTWGHGPSSSSTMGGWRLSGTWGWVALLAWPLTLLALVTGPEPRGATAWAWFWLILSPAGLLVAPAYLLWGARGHRGGRRLTGGWAFVLAWLVLDNLSLPW